MSSRARIPGRLGHTRRSGGRRSRAGALALAGDRVGVGSVSQDGWGGAGGVATQERGTTGRRPSQVQPSRVVRVGRLQGRRAFDPGERNPRSAVGSAMSNFPSPEASPGGTGSPEGGRRSGARSGRGSPRLPCGSRPAPPIALAGRVTARSGMAPGDHRHPGGGGPRRGRSPLQEEAPRDHHPVASRGPRRADRWRGIGDRRGHLQESAASEDWRSRYRWRG
jgi:hypothetical protein